MDDQTPKSRILIRRRRQNVAGGRQHRHVVRVSPEEEAVLARLAEEQQVSVPRLMVEAALSVGGVETPTERRNAIAELFRLQRQLATISNNVNQMARIANTTFSVPSDLPATLQLVRDVAMSINETVDRLASS